VAGRGSEREFESLCERGTSLKASTPHREPCYAHIRKEECLLFHFSLRMASSRNRPFDLVTCLWHRPCSGLGTTRMCLGEGPRLESSLTWGNAVRYAQKQDKPSFFSNVTTVLSLSGQVPDHKGAFSGSEESSSDRAPAQTPPKWQDRGIITVECNHEQRRHARPTDNP
jgi:hypothetical protein